MSSGRRAHQSKLDALVELAYGTLDDNGTWEPFLVALSDAISGRAAILLHHDLSQGRAPATIVRSAAPAGTSRAGVACEQRDVGRPPVVVLMTIVDPLRRPVLDETALRDAFGFTPAEARFAAGLAAGLTPSELADRLKLSRATARWLTEQVREKTQARTQAAAMRALLTSIAVLQNPPRDH